MNVLSCRFKSGRPQTDPKGSVFFCESAAFNTIPAFPAIFLSAQREFSRLSSERRPKARGIEAQMSGRRKGGAGQSGSFAGWKSREAANCSGKPGARRLRRARARNEKRQRRRTTRSTSSASRSSSFEKGETALSAKAYPAAIFSPLSSIQPTMSLTVQRWIFGVSYHS